MSDLVATLAVESPRQAEVARLLEALDAYQSGLYPPKSNHFLDVEALAAPNVRFIVARRGRRRWAAARDVALAMHRSPDTDPGLAVKTRAEGCGGGAGGGAAGWQGQHRAKN